MTAAKKLYRKEDIINMGSKEVNKGWGPKGNSNTYSIWLWKGGAVGTAITSGADVSLKL
jgi:hypothetical protein